MVLLTFDTIFELFGSRQHKKWYRNRYTIYKKSNFEGFNVKSTKQPLIYIQEIIRFT